MSKETPKVTPKKSKIFLDPTIKQGEIVLAIVTYTEHGHDKKIEAVYKRPTEGTLMGEIFKKRFKRDAKASWKKIKRIDIKVRLGMEHNSTGYSLAKKSEETRDPLTGKFD